jgi:hypothetical protein
MKRTAISLLATLLGLFALTGASAALAADATTAAADAAAVGYHLDTGVTISSSDATQIVSTARNGGSRFYLVVLAETPDGGDTVLAENVLDTLGVDTGTVLVLSPEDVGWASEGEFSDVEMVAAFEYANARGGNDADYAANFVVSLVGAPAGATTVAPAGGAASSGSGAGLIWFFVIIGAVVLLVIWLVQRSKKQTVNAAAEQLAKARLAVQKQIDAVANDILDMEDEVRVADSEDAGSFYNEAADTYRAVSDEVAAAATPQQLLDISNRLDVAIWQLDTAEAILDGKPRPPRPEPKRLEPEPAAEPAKAPVRQTDYQRRSSRRSSYLGPGMLDILVGVAGQVLAGRGRRRGFGGRLGGGIAGGSPGRRAGRSVMRRASGGGARARRSTPRRSGGGRVRGGGRRGR